MVKAKSNNENVKRDFAASNLHDWVDCDNCGARRCIYSNNYVGNNDGPRKKYKKRLLNWKENECVCFNKNGAEYYVIRRLLRCGNQIETQYYNSEIITVKPTNGRVSTDLIYCLCYYDHHISSAGEIKRIQDVGGKNPLPLCGQCFDSALESKIAVPTTKGSRNHKEKSSQKRASKKREFTPRL